MIVLGGLIGAYFIPADRRLGPMAGSELAAAGDTGADLSAEYQQAARNEGIAGAVAGVLILVAVFLMVVKPGA